LYSEPIIKVGFSVIIENGRGEILLQYCPETRDWRLPSDLINLGEHLEEKALKQVEQGTGLQVKELVLYRMFSGKEFAFSYPEGIPEYQLTAIYIAKRFNGNLRINESKSHEQKFFSLYDLPNRFHDSSKEFVDQYAADHFWIGG
jgi:ADP-ribose pyrophosphatase YjhB (NUDIX family)